MSGTGRSFHVEHRSAFRYADTAHGSVMLLRLRPREDLGQRVRSFALRIEPAAVPVAADDSFGNVCHLFNIHRAHGHTTVRSVSQVETGGGCAIADAGGSWKDLSAFTDPARHWEYLAPSRFTRPTERLRSFVSATGIERQESPLGALQALSETLYDAFTYTPGSTTVDSPIDRILESRAGVCQDYVHVMLAIARSWGVPARYVSGYLHLEGAHHEQSVEGASHAWAEFLLPETGWVGFDPTNDTMVDHRHIRVAVGRDYADVAPTRGAVFGGGDTELSVAVTVTPSSDDPAVISPRREPTLLWHAEPTRHAPAVDQ